MAHETRTYIWQQPDWPQWRYALAALAAPLTEVAMAQGKLFGALSQLGLEVRERMEVDALTSDVLKTSAIEGEHFPPQSVRSSVARRLGVELGALVPGDRNAEGVVDMVLDATARCHDPLSEERLFAWHAALFPTGYSGLQAIQTGAWRRDEQGPMQVVSGRIGRQKVHFEAPGAAQLPAEMARFVHWANTDASHPALIKAGLAHLWFVTLHPFEDGNGRIARAVGDLFLARADASPQRYYSLAAQIQREREAYYQVLEQTQQSSMDVTAWLQWFLRTVHLAVEHALAGVGVSQQRNAYWSRFADVMLNARQQKVLNRLFEGFEGRLGTAKYAALAKTSTDTALRDISALVDAGMLVKAPGGGRSSAYALPPEFVEPGRQ
jgi:Fic family protein